eukprot:6205103-Pleurochrysis_carterae.AAC.2
MPRRSPARQSTTRSRVRPEAAVCGLQAHKQFQKATRRDRPWQRQGCLTRDMLKEKSPRMPRSSTRTTARAPQNSKKKRKRTDIKPDCSVLESRLAKTKRCRKPVCSTSEKGCVQNEWEKSRTRDTYPGTTARFVACDPQMRLARRTF